MISEETKNNSIVLGGSIGLFLVLGLIRDELPRRPGSKAAYF